MSELLTLIAQLDVFSKVALSIVGIYCVYCVYLVIMSAFSFKDVDKTRINCLEEEKIRLREEINKYIRKEADLKNDIANLKNKSIERVGLIKELQASIDEIYTHLLVGYEIKCPHCGETYELKPDEFDKDGDDITYCLKCGLGYRQLDHVEHFILKHRKDDLKASKKEDKNDNN